MELTIEASGETSADDLGQLRGWLLDEPSLRGRVQLRQAPAAAGTMPGGIIDGLLLAMAGGGTAAVAVQIRATGSVLIAWLKTRRGDVRLEVADQQGHTVTLSATNVKGLSGTEVSRLIDRLSALAGGEPSAAAVDSGQPPQDAAGHEGLPREPDGTSRTTD